MPLDLLTPVEYGTDVDREAGAPVRAVGGALVAGGLLGLVMSPLTEGLSPSQKAIGALSGGLTVAAGSAALVIPGRSIAVARRAPRPLAAACYAVAAASTSLGGGHKSPSYFPAVLLTAIGSGLSGDARSGRAAGTAVAGAWLAGCSASYGLARRPPSRGMWWGAGASLAFPTAGHVGALVGDLAMLARSLGFYAEREGDHRSKGSGREEVERAARTVREGARQFLQSLPEVRDHFAGDEAAGRATAEIATALASMDSATLRLQTQEEGLELLQQLQRLADKHNLTGSAATVRVPSGRRRSPRSDADTTGAVVDACVALVQNAANAGVGRHRRVNVEIRVGVTGVGRRRWLNVVVEDDAGGGTVDRDRWGSGLKLTDDAVQRLGGQLHVGTGAAGVRVEMQVPYVQAGRLAPLPASVTGQAEQARETVLAGLRAGTVGQAAFMMLAVTPGPQVKRRALRVAAIAAVGEIAERLPSERVRAVSHGALTATAMTAFGGPGSPPMAGWSATLAASVAARHELGLATIATLTSVAGAIVVAGPERFESGLEATVADRTFPLVGLMGGAAISWALRKLAEQERALADETWMRLVLEDLAAPGRGKHHFLEPLEDALGADRWREFEESPLGRRLRVLYGIGVREAQQVLEGHLRLDDPLVLLQRQLARLLAPATVRVHGSRPAAQPPRRGQELDPVRFRLGLIGVGGAVVRRVRHRLPSTILGSAGLQELSVTVRPDGSKTRLEIAQIPWQAGRDDRDDAILASACRRAGGDAAASTGERFVVTVHSSALT